MCLQHLLGGSHQWSIWRFFNNTRNPFKGYSFVVTLPSKLTLWLSLMIVDHTSNGLRLRYPQPRKSLQHVLWNYTSQWKRSATTPNPAWPCNTALPNGTLAIRCTFSYLQRACFGSTSHWKRWWQTLQQRLCPWTSFYHRWSSSTQWHRTHCSASQWNASDQMHIFLSIKSIFWQHFTMETLTANTAAKPVSLNFDLLPLK